MGNQPSGGMHSGSGGYSVNARANPNSNTGGPKAPEVKQPEPPKPKAWEYRQATGVLCTPEGVCKPLGYSGAGAGKNNPAAQNLPFVGPIPEGTYNIGPSYNSATTGPVSMKLKPTGGQEMHGRDNFMIHPDSIKAPGTASQGCIVLPKPTREAIAKSEVKTLVVTSGNVDDL